MSKRAPGEILRTNLLEHPAIQAWNELRPARVEPEHIETLQARRRRPVYRLASVGPAASDIIAKRSEQAKGVVERAIYEEILPHLAITAPRYYGLVEEPDGEFCWLFLEDAGAEQYSPLIAAHRVLAAQWLGHVHTSGARSVAAARLPDRGPGHYLAHLHSGRDRMRRGLSNPALQPHDVAVLNNLISQCDFLEARWNEVERCCAGMPRTLVHADFAPKNMRIRTDQGGLTLLVFDWGTAGWGVPAADLVQSGKSSDNQPGATDLAAYWASPDLGVYCSVVRAVWPHLELRDMQRLATIGKVFRCLLCLNLEALSLETEWVEKCMWNMRLYQDEIAEAIRAGEWRA